MINHLVYLTADREKLTQTLRDDITGLAALVRAECGIPIRNEVVFSEPAFSSAVGVLSHWQFASQQDLDSFRQSRAHLAHVERIRTALLNLHVVDIEQAE